MNYKNEYGNVYTCVLSIEKEDWVKNIIDNILPNKVNYVEFMILNLKHSLLSANIANDFITKYPEVLIKHEYIVIKVMVDDDILAISIGNISKEGKSEFVWGIVND